MDDSRIVTLFFERNEEGIKEAEQKYKRYLQGIAGNILPSKEDAEECVSDTYLAAWQSIPPNKPSNLAAYLGKLVRNFALDKLEKQNAQKRQGECLSLQEEIAEIMADDREELIDSIALREAINRFLKTLPKDKRVLFMRRYFFFDSVKEIAKSQKQSESRVKTALFRIRLNLKEYLLTEGILL